MRSPNIRYIPELDQLRGLAAVLVLYFHALASATVVSHYMGTNAAGVPTIHNPLQLFIANGFTGVALFFVISGFLFTWGTLQSEHVSWRNFYINRALRILPLYLLLIFVTLSVGRGSVPIGDMIMTALGFGNYNPPHNDFDVVLWTISIEMQFYLLFPFLITMLKRLGARFIAGLIGVMILLRGLVWLDGLPLHNPIYWTIFGRLDQFLVGMLLAWYIHHRGWLSTKRMASRQTAGERFALIGLLAAAVATMLAAFWLYTGLGWKYGDSAIQIVWPLLEACLWALLGTCYVGIVMHIRAGFMRPVQFVGMISYSLYLLHYPIVKALNQSGLLVQLPTHIFLGGLISTTLQILPVSIAVATITYYAIEKPPLTYRKHYTEVEKVPALR